MLYTFENVQAKSAVRPQMASAGAVNGAAIDTEGFGDAMIVIDVGASTGTPTSFAVAAKVQESANGSSGWTDISGAAITDIAAVNKSAQIGVNISTVAARARYIRVVITPSFSGGTSPTVAIQASALLGNPERTESITNSTVSA